MQRKFNIIGLGEILWDIFPEEKRLGGASANFVYHISSLGHNGLIISKVGNDRLGKDIVKKLFELGLGTSYIQIDSEYLTGKVNVYFDSKG